MRTENCRVVQDRDEGLPNTVREFRTEGLWHKATTGSPLQRTKVVRLQGSQQQRWYRGIFSPSSALVAEGGFCISVKKENNYDHY